MEIKNNSETLEQGFLVSKTENPCNKILEEESGSGFLCNLSGNCTADVYSGHNAVGYGSIQESFVFDGIAGNNRMNKDNLNNAPIDELLDLTNGDEINDNDMLDLERDLGFSGNDEIQIREFAELVEKCDDVLCPREPSSPTKIEVSGNGINLFVEVFGPLGGIYDGNNNERNTREHVLGKTQNETPSSCVKNANSENEDGKIVGDRESTFDLGDLVWVKTRTELWWPGIVSDPSFALKDVTKSEKMGSVLVKYFGNANSLLCSNSELKPFLEYFEPMSRQNTSRNFLSSVEKALSEIGHRVKSKITCPCFSKKSLTLEKRTKFDVLSVSRFEPASFVARIKNLACSVSPPGKIELTFMKSHLSAFYYSLGHCEFPLQLLRSSSDDGDTVVLDDKMTSSGKSFESRERKKSKYLSYPFIEETDDVKDLSSQSTKSTHPPSNSRGKNSRKKGSKKAFVGPQPHIVSKADDIDACSSELLAELHSTARDCFYLGQSKYSDSLKRFYTSFRVFSFLDADIDISCKVPKRDKRLIIQNSTEGESSVNIEFSKISQEEGSVVVRKKRAYKKKEKVILESISNSSAMGSNITTENNNSCMISFQTSSDVAKKRKVGPAVVSTLPDLNGNNQPSFSIEHMPAGEPLGNNIIGSIPSLMDAQVTLQNTHQLNNGFGINGTNQFPNAGFTIGDLESNMINNNGFGLFFQKSLQMGPFPSSPAAKLEPRKRKRNENSCQVPSLIPDLNGNILDPNTPVKTLPEGNHISPEVKDNNESATTEPSSNVKAKRVLNKIEDPGGSILLNFAQETTLPTKETLVKTFSRFGLLKESEIQVLNDLTVEIVYERSSDAGFAFRSLGKNNPFGESLTTFKLHNMPAGTGGPPRTKVKRSYSKKAHQPVGPGPGPSAQAGERPNIAFMRKNVEMMKLALERAGDNLSTEMRGELENEIKGFLDKIGSSSSS